MSIFDVFMCKEGILSLLITVVVYGFAFAYTRKKMKIYKRYCEKLEVMLTKAMEINKKFSDVSNEALRIINEPLEFEAVGRIDED